MVLPMSAQDSIYLHPSRWEQNACCRKGVHLQRGTVSCRGDGARSHPHRPQRRKASSAKEERDQPLCMCGLRVKEKDTL